MSEDPSFDLATTFVHLGLGARAFELPDFEWTPEYLASYANKAAADGIEGRLVMMGRQSASWDSWERHPAGDEVVVLLNGRVDLIQDIRGKLRVVELRPGRAVINPRNIWHTADVHEPGDALFITPAKGTEHKPR